MLPNYEIIIRLLIAALLGSIVGWERQRKDWAAGLRTHMLVCVGATLFMIVSAWGFSDVLGKPAIVLDPSRIAAQVVSGIGFLGAGTILFLRHQVVRGLTTAAGLWGVAAVGLSIGGGLYVAGLAATIIIVLILAVLKPLEQRFFSTIRLKTITLIIETSETTIPEIEEAASSLGLELSEIKIQNPTEKHLKHIELTFGNRSAQKNIMILLEELRKKPGVKDIHFWG